MRWFRRILLPQFSVSYEVRCDRLCRFAARRECRLIAWSFIGRFDVFSFRIGA